MRVMGPRVSGGRSSPTLSWGESGARAVAPDGVTPLSAELASGRGGLRPTGLPGAALPGFGGGPLAAAAGFASGFADFAGAAAFFGAALGAALAGFFAAAGFGGAFFGAGLRGLALTRPPSRR